MLDLERGGVRGGVREAIAGRRIVQSLCPPSPSLCVNDKACVLDPESFP